MIISTRTLSPSLQHPVEHYDLKLQSQVKSDAKIQLYTVRSWRTAVYRITNSLERKSR